MAKRHAAPKRLPPEASMNVYLILGEANSGKSSCVRALTGAGRTKVVSVATRDGNRRVFTVLGALQELGWTTTQLIAKASSKDCTDVLVPLRIRRRITGGKRYPPASKYVSEFLATGWHIQGFAVLGATSLEEQLPGGVPRALFLPDAATNPVNETAARIRRSWDWR